MLRTRRTATALAHKREERIVYGSTPFGYRRVGSALVPEPVEQDAIAEAQRMDAAGASYRAIGAMLEGRGVKPKRAKVWHAASVRAMLQSKIATSATTVA